MTSIFDLIAILFSGIGVYCIARSVVYFMKMSGEVKTNTKLLTAFLPLLIFSDKSLSGDGVKYRKEFIKYFGIAFVLFVMFSFIILLREY